MSKDILCIVSHSHWDREWYLSHSEHNYRLIKFMDRLLSLLEKDQNFKTFHLDGQVVILEDYLKIRPEKEKLIKKMVKNGRLKIGPFYILQDEYLVSGEANIRNILIGLKSAKKFGHPTMTGYFPDAFGNIAQIPQILQGFGIDNVFFGRGTVPNGYADEVLGKSSEGFSELIWEGSDGSKVIGVQFINWYNNAVQLPNDKEQAVERVNQIINRAKLGARTKYLLGMNGSDHQPVQTDLSEIIKKVKGSVDVEIIHTSLENYISLIKPFKNSFSTYKGEIEGQNGNGYHTLINTASSRIYLKQLNYKAQHLLENCLEPLSCILKSYGGDYDSGMIYGLYKLLLHNHPHDSICGCGVDSVHEKMVTRFNEVIDGGESLKKDLLEDLATKIYSEEDKIAVFNTNIRAISGLVCGEMIFPIEKELPDNPSFFLDGNELLCDIVVTEEPTYILPRDRFREVFQCKKLKYSVYLKDVPPTSFLTLNIDEKKGNVSDLRVGERFCENSKIKIEFAEDGSFKLTDKRSGKSVHNLNYFEETGDSGNEYEFIQSGSVNCSLNYKAEFSFEIKTSYITFFVKNKINTQDNSLMEIVSAVTITPDSEIVQIRTEFDNNGKNHRIRALFDSGLSCDKDYACGQYDITERKINNGPRWKNLNNPQRAENFVYLHNGYGIVTGMRGLHEYEILKDNKIALTLMRGVGEMGDWFYFPTQESQCLGKNIVEYSVSLFDDNSKNETLNNIFLYCRPSLFPAQIHLNNEGFIKKPQSLISAQSNSLIQFGALKLSEDGSGYILRIANLNNFEAPILFNKNITKTNLAEKIRLKNGKAFSLRAKEIFTAILDKTDEI